MKQPHDRQEIAQLLSRFMAGETSVAEEQLLAHYFRTHAVDEEWAEYKEMFALFDSGAVDIEVNRKPKFIAHRGRAGMHALPAGLTAMRIILTSAAVYLTGLFLWLQQEPTEPVRQADNGQPVQEAVVPCTEGTPDEIIMCYLEQRETRPNTYNLIRRMLYENKQ